ncbi:MAG: hypothetical protein WBK55_09575 [Alphaproteobacteria bacterium]
MNDRGLLLLIAVLLVAILGVLFVQYNEPRNDGISGSVGEVVEEIGDEIDDNTTAK